MAWVVQDELSGMEFLMDEHNSDGRALSSIYGSSSVAWTLQNSRKTPIFFQQVKLISKISAIIS